MSKQINQKLYDLIPSQQTMYYMVKFSLHKSVTQIPASVTVKEKLDFGLLKKALNVEIERNDALRIRFTKVKGKIKQYFLDSYKIDNVPVMTFRTKEQQEEALGADAQKPVRFLKDETFRVIFFNSYDGGCGIYANMSHIMTDALGVSLFFMDLLSVYRALKNGTAMPEPLSSYEEHIHREFEYLNNDKLHKKDAAFYVKYWKEGGMPFYAGIHGPGLLEKARKKDPDITVPKAYDLIHDKSKVIHRYISPEDTDKIYEYCKKNFVVPENVLLYAFRAHASKINYRTPDVLTIVMCSRRASYADKFVGGCIAQPIQVRVKTPETDTFREAVGRVASCRNQLLRHMNFPYLEARYLQQKEYNLVTSQGPSCFMLSWLPVGLLAQKLDHEFDFTAYNLGRYVMPLYIFAVPDAKTGGTDIYYMYRTNTLTADHINLLHENAVKAIRMGLDDPDITVGELLDNLDDLKA